MFKTKMKGSTTLTQYEFTARAVRHLFSRALIVGFNGGESAVLVTSNLCRRYDDMDMLVVDLATLVTGSDISKWSGYSLTHDRRQAFIKGFDMWEIAGDEIASFLMEPDVRTAKGMEAWVNGRGYGLPFAVRQFWAFLGLAPHLPTDVRDVVVPPGLTAAKTGNVVVPPVPKDVNRVTLNRVYGDVECDMEEQRRKAGHRC